MESNLQFDNLTIFSVMRLIFTHRAYRMLYLYAASTTVLTNDFSNKISELSNNYTIPISVMSFNQIPLNRSKCEGPIVNVMLVNNLSTSGEIGQFKPHLRPNEVNLILLTSYNKMVSQVNFKPWMKSDKKVLIMSNRFLVSINQFRFDQIRWIPLQPFNVKATKRFIHDIFTEKGGTMNGTKINIFMQHLPPKSAVSASKHGDIFTGPDGCLSELLVKFLNVSPTFWSDIGVMYPSFREWAKDPLVAQRMHYREYHEEVVTSNSIAIFNRT